MFTDGDTCAPVGIGDVDVTAESDAELDVEGDAVRDAAALGGGVPRGEVDSETVEDSVLALLGGGVAFGEPETDADADDVCVPAGGVSR